jgi:hypothetical protein
MFSTSQNPPPLSLALLSNSEQWLKYVDFGLAKQFIDRRDGSDDIIRLDLLFNQVIKWVSFSTPDFETRLQNIAYLIANGAFFDMDLLARDLQTIYAMDCVNNSSGVRICDLMWVSNLE